jgi:DNA-directed RNA polymerase specialized sigma24 family protein
MRTGSRFEQLFLPHLDAAYSLARWIVGRDQDAQDIVQEAYARALKGFSGRFVKQRGLVTMPTATI